jgi:hypothetical protein
LAYRGVIFVIHRPPVAAQAGGVVFLQEVRGSGREQMNFKRLLITASFINGITLLFALLSFANQASAEVNNRGPSREDVIPSEGHDGTGNDGLSRAGQRWIPSHFILCKL